MNLSAIFHRCSDNYCYCLNEDEIVISIKTGYDVKRVYLCYGDPFTRGIMGSNQTFEEKEDLMSQRKNLDYHILWTHKVKPEFKRLVYYFKIEDDTDTYYMMEDKFYSPSELHSFKGRRQAFMFPWMNPADIITVPKWVNSTIWYQIFVERFCNGNKKINPENTSEWRSSDKKVKYHEFFGGDLPGIISKIPYLENLGITGLYLTPVCESPSNHKYDITNYSKIDPCFGTDKDMINLVSTAHNHGIKVMMDGVFNHSGMLFAPWQDVLKKGPESKYFHWFMINKWPLINDGKYGNAKECRMYSFAFYDQMPKLNTNNPSVIDYIVNIVSDWVKKYDIDALRLDVAGEISHLLCKELNKALKSIKPDFYIIGELWHDSIPWLRGDQYDSVMNYAFGDSLNNFWSDETSCSESLEHSINRCYSLYPEQMNEVLFNLLDSHDTMRLMTRVKNIYAFYQQLTMLFTMPGTVCIYYGTEIALKGSYDPDCRRCMPWDEINTGKHYRKYSVIKKLINLRKEYACLRSNNYQFVIIPENPRIIQYDRFDSEGKKITVILNCSNDDYSYSVHKNNILFSLKYEKKTLKPNGILISLS